MMLWSDTHITFWLYRHPTDMRRSFDGLSAMVRNIMQENPQSGQVFIFVNRRRTQLKALYFDRNGYCVFAKRLSQGQFPLPKSGVDDKKQCLSQAEFLCLLEGIDVVRFKRRKRLARRDAYGRIWA